jgi:hypothetical protein
MKNMTFDGDPYPKNRTYDVDSDPAETVRTHRIWISKKRERGKCVG